MTDGTVYDRLDAAYRDMAEIRFTKDRHVPSGKNGYDIIPISQILSAVQTVHAKHGIKVLFGPVRYDPAQCEKRYSVKGDYGTTERANGHVDVLIVGSGPDDCIEMTVSCEAQDSSDKLNNKLMTNAMRTLYRTLYAIDGDEAQDPEEANVPAPVQRTGPVRTDDPFFTDGGFREMKRAVRAYAEEHPDDDILASVAEINGHMDRWSLGTYKHVHQALKQEGRI